MRTYITEVQRKLKLKAIRYCMGYPVPADEVDDIKSEINNFLAENHWQYHNLTGPEIAERLRAEINSSDKEETFQLGGDPKPREIIQTITPHMAVMAIFNQALKEGWTFQEVFAKAYADPTCKEYYKSEAGLWLMTMVFQTTIGSFVAQNKEDFYQQSQRINDEH